MPTASSRSHIKTWTGKGCFLKRFALLLSISTLLFAYTYHDTILQVYAKVLPKVLVINQPKEIPLEQIDICIVHEEGDIHYVQLLEKAIGSLYAKGISGISITTRSVAYTSIQTCHNTNALMLMQSTPEQIQSAVDYALEHHIFTASYNASELSRGVIFSLDITERVKPYLNVKAAKSAKVPLDSALMQISTIYRDGGNP